MGSQNQSKTKVITGKVRFSYVQVFEPKAMEEGQKEKYSVSLIISKKDKKTIAAIESAIDEAKRLAKTNLWGGKIPSVLKGGLRDGDEEKPDNPEYENSFFINANSIRRPGLVDADLNPILDRDEFYSGCYGRASIDFYGYITGSKGVACGLNNLQKLEDGEPLSGSAASAEDDFGDDDDLMK